jgi:hypothetical protein
MSDKTWYIKPGALIKTTLAELMGLEPVQVKIDMLAVDTATGFPYLDLEKDMWAIYDRTWSYYGDKNFRIHFNVETREIEPTVAEPPAPLAIVFDRIARKLTFPYLGTITEEKILEETKETKETKETDAWFERMHDNMHQAELLRPWN